MIEMDRDTLYLVGGTLALLILASGIGAVLTRIVHSETGRATVRNMKARTRSWWIMVFIFSLALATGGIGSVILFSLLSFLALREFVTLAPTRRGDHRALFWAFFVVVPLQYLLIYFRWYGLFSILIPVYAFLFIPIRIVL